MKIAIPNRQGWQEPFEKFAKFLAEKLQTELELEILADESVIADELNGNSVDLAILTSTAFVRAQSLLKGLRYISTAKTKDEGKERTYYDSLLITRASLGINGIEGFAGKKLGFVKESSSSGYLVPLNALLKQGIDPKKYFSKVEFLGSHDAVTEAVASGQVDLGATWDLSLEKAEAKHGKTFKTIATYGPVTNHAVVARPGIEGKLHARMSSILSEMTEDECKNLGIPYSGFEPVANDAYDFARAMILEYRKVDLKIKSNDLRLVIIRFVLDLIREMRIKERSKASTNGESFVSREPAVLIRMKNGDEMIEQAKQELENLLKPNSGPASSELKSFVEEISKYLEKLTGTSTTAKELVVLHKELQDVRRIQFGNPNGVLSASEKVKLDTSQEELVVSADTGSRGKAFLEAVRSRTANDEYLSSISQLLMDARASKLPLTADEEIAVDGAKLLLESGVTLPPSYGTLKTSGFGKYQTQLYSTDPGDDHLRITCSDNKFLEGVVVHVEHIDRDGQKDKELVEAYRLPAPLNVAKVRLHVGTDAPCSAYIGRPVFESASFNRDLLKSAHMTAAACTAMFINGVVDCKVAIERMRASQAIEFMRCISGNVFRDKHRQFLAAAINLNTPVIDDRRLVLKEEKFGLYESDPIRVGFLGIEMAKEGGFDKVTWDGASDGTSKPILGQVDFEDLLELVHKAHSLGMICYISAGLKSDHMKEATYLGIDGVGIGNSLHFLKKNSAGEILEVGAFEPKAIEECLAVRNDAMGHTLGIAGQLLARLDRLFFEENLPNPKRDDELREELLQALKKRDINACKKKIDELQHVLDLFSVETDHPIIERANRRIIADKYRKRHSLRVTESARPFKVAAKSTELLEELIATRQISRLAEILS